VNDSDSEQRLASVLAEVTDAVCRGEVIDLNQCCDDHPDLAADLRQLWATILVTDTAGKFDSQPQPRPNDDSQRLSAATSTLGDYELIQQIGSGGMGVVYRARQTSLDREVAVKMILPDRLASDADLRRFMAEASATAKLEHPNIVPVYDVGSIDGRPYFSMQLIEGTTLAERVQAGVLPQQEAATIVAVIARAIGFAHGNGILHRDIKPSNILITPAGKPLVTDFGLAKQASGDSDITRSGTVIGTPSYMSPEQASGRGELVGPASDVYSLGCVLYFALTGQPPLVADSPLELMMRVIEQDPLPPRFFRPGLDRDLEMIVIRALQKPIDLRYESATALAADLEAYLADEPVAARSGRFTQVIARVFRETHHAPVLENWGTLWIWHSLALWIAGMLTWQLSYHGVQQRSVYIFVWTVGLGTWAAVFWGLRRRMGPVTFVERQIAHIWGASMVAIAALFPIEWWMGVPVLTLSPVLGVISSMVFIIKAGILSGEFYLQAIALLITAGLMTVFPAYAHLLFGFVAAGCFFVPGFKYRRRRLSPQTIQRL
jgi:serine/threonine-protein kinase